MAELLGKVLKIVGKDLLCSYKNYIILFRAGRNLHGQKEYAVFIKLAEIIIGGSV